MLRKLCRNFALKRVSKKERAPKVVSKREPIEFESLKSLFYKFRNLDDVSKTRKEELNLRMFGGEKGSSLNEMTSEQIKAIDLRATEQLQELEESGLSKEAVLGLQVPANSTVPLSADSFFQRVKSNPGVRKALLGRHGEYSVATIVHLALKQDIGVDSAASGTGRKVYNEETGVARHDPEILDPLLIKKEKVSDHFISDQVPSTDEYPDVDYFGSFRPIRTAKMSARKETPLNLLDLHWRNTPLLIRFMTNHGTIKHYRATGLSRVNQFRVARTIDRARKMRLLPYANLIKGYHRVPLTNLEEDVYFQDANEVDMQTGALNLKKRSDIYPFDSDHHRVSLSTLEGTDNQAALLESDEKVEMARQYAIHLKKEDLKEQFGASKLSSLFTEALQSVTDRKNYLSPEQIESSKLAYEELKKQYKNFPDQEFFNLFLSERKGDSVAIDHIVKGHRIVDGVSAPEEDASKLLEELKSLKKKIAQDSEFVSKSFLQNDVENSLFKPSK